MSFVCGVFRHLDQIEGYKFIDDKIEFSGANSDEPFFFLQDLIKSVYSKKLLNSFEGKTKIHRLEKTPVTCLNDSDAVNPEFIQTLKKATIAWMETLSTDWRECTNEEKETLKQAGHRIADQDLVITKQCEKCFGFYNLKKSYKLSRITFIDKGFEHIVYGSASNSRWKFQ